jgi:hypothetical protein
VSLLKDFFWYTSVPKDSFERAEDISVRRQAERLRGLYFNLNLILVGEGFPDAIQQTLDNDVAYARRLFGGAGIGIGRVKRWRIRQDDVGQFDELDSSIEAHFLWASFSAGTDGIDVFVVRSYRRSGEAKAGVSPVDGSCDHSGFDSGVAIIHNGGMANLAHEVSHYLGLDHPDNEDNVNDPMIEGMGAMASAHFSAEQGETMRDHCMMRRPCP